MKKKSIIVPAVAVVIVGSLFIAPVQTVVVNAMGVFRVSDPNVINVSMDDMTAMAQSAQTLMSAYEQQNSGDQSEQDSQDNQSGQSGDQLSQYEKTLTSASDFTAFPFKLPTSLSDQTPEITEIDAPAQTVPVNVADVNKMLAAVQSPVTLSDNYDGRKVTVTPAAVVMADYEDASVMCFALQKPTFDLPGKMDQDIAQIVTSQPMLPDDIRTQLSAINFFDKNIYLPNIEGVTKTADLGGSVTGYIYAVNDVATLSKNLLSSMQSGSSSMQDQIRQMFQKYAGYEVIVWVNGNTLYGVLGNYTDDQLSALARTMR